MEVKSVKILGVKIHQVTNETAYNRFLALMEQPKLSIICTPNTEIVMEAQNDPELKEILQDADLVIPDGIGLIYASKIHQLGLTERVTGIDTLERILKYANNTKKSIYLFGGKPGVAEKAAERMMEVYPNLQIKGIRDGFYKKEEEDKIINHINEVKPDILFVALGAPRQEKWIYNNRKILNAKVAMGVGGALDVWAGSAKRAPKIFQNMHLEWFYRLLKNPTRIGRMMSLPKFMIKVLISRDFNRPS
jgi:N-acetylglucosaminyldiphosphoundecaprenol N-acetyl-beta-D-mannosaminyltransferase